MAAFNRVGYEGTNTNAIAREAGFAPQTFYRHFPDKLDVFIACYERWTAEEEAALGPASTPAEFTVALVAHHAAFRLFRRSLRALAASEPRVAAVRGRARAGQIAALARRSTAFAVQSPAAQLAHLLALERLCDALAEGEHEALGVEEAALRAEIERIITTLQL